jgi:hypothetical protein
MSLGKSQIKLLTFDNGVLLLSHQADIAEAFILHDADPLINSDSQVASLVQGVFGANVPD